MAVSEVHHGARPSIADRMGRLLAPWPLFLKGFLKHPAMVGSIMPSSRALVDAMLAPVDWSKVELFVEYGPGVGTFTRHILDRLRPDATLLTIDTNEDFARYLARTIRDSRFLAVHGSAADVREIMAEHGFAEADHILSGIPFSTLPDGVGQAIMAETEAALKPGGSFLVYQYSNYVLGMMARHFAAVDRGLTWWNVPPCRLFWGHKPEAVPARIAA